MSQSARVILIAAMCMLAEAWPLRAAEYELRSQDRIRLKVYDWPRMDGDYTIDTGGWITLPELGRIRAMGANPLELSGRISANLSAKSTEPSNPIVSVEVVSSAPIAVLGEVQRPGEYQGRFGMTVLQAVSVAGGYFRREQSPLRWERDAIVAKSEVDVLSQQLVRLKIRMLRLGAELEGLSSLNVPKWAEDLVRKNEAIVAHENAVLSDAIMTRDRRDSSLANLQSLYEQQINTLKAQIESERRQQASVEGELAEVRALASKGLTLAPRQLSLERTLAQITGVQNALQTEILRARQTMEQAKQNLVEQRAEGRRQTMTELDRIEAELGQVQVRLGQAEKLYQEAISASGAAQTLATGKYNFSITRYSENKVQTVDAKRDTVVVPGDVIEVYKAPE